MNHIDEGALRKLFRFAKGFFFCMSIFVEDGNCRGMYHVAVCNRIERLRKANESIKMSSNILEAAVRVLGNRKVKEILNGNKILLWMLNYTQSRYEGTPEDGTE